MLRIEGLIAAVLLIGQLQPPTKTNDPDPAEILKLAAARIVERAAHLPKLYCTQQIARSKYSLRHPLAESSGCSSLIPDEPITRNSPWQLVWTDRMHVDVAIFADRELFGWPGSGQFTANDPSQLIGTGAGGSGGFGSFLLSVFGTKGVVFTFRDKDSFAGHPVYRYAYEVPVELSGYRVRAGQGSVTTGYRGEFLLDITAQTVDELTVNVDRAPPESGLCKVAQKIQYHQMTLYDSSFLLPSTSTISHLDRTDVLYESKAEYTGCREFSAQTSLSFDTADGEKASQAKTAGLALPASLAVDIEVLTRIDFEKNRAGDSVVGKLMHPIEYKGRVLVPVAAVIRGRIAGLEHTLRPHDFYTLALTFQSFELPDGASGSLTLRPNSYGSRSQVQNGLNVFIINSGKRTLSSGELAVFAITLAP